MSLPCIEGTAPFAVADTDKECYTWYKVYGTLAENTIPLMVLHGGPGAGHEYLSNLSNLTLQHQIPVVLYDQIGCGNSTALPEKNDVKSFWTVELFERELENLRQHLKIDKYDLFGHSWGGMLASVFAAKHPPGLRKLVLMGTPASTDLVIEGATELTKQLPQSVQDTIREAEETQDYASPAYKEACLEFYKRFLCRLDPWPAELMTSMGHLEEDPTVYSTMFGPSELVCTGSLKHWTSIPVVHQIQSPTLLINGRYDEIVDYETSPLFERIPKVKWVILDESSHTGNWEQPDRFMQVLSQFII